MNISIKKLPRPEQSGDWHDKPNRWVVRGPGIEIQKFSTKADATVYAKIRREAFKQSEAIKKFAVTPVSVSEINKVLAMFCKERLRRGKGYYYFYGGDAAGWHSSSVYVSTLESFTVEGWVAERNRLAGL